MDPKSPRQARTEQSIPDQKSRRATQDRLPGLADDRQRGRGDSGVVPGGARDNGSLRNLLVGCPGGYCELCPVAMQIECEKDIS
ncbi:MAG: hypothetical protein ABFS18_02035 [Thermodesulfobacteriota bacterium]